MQDTMPKKRPYSESFWSGCGKMRETVVTYLQYLTHDGGPYHIETKDVQIKSMDWFLYHKDVRHERVNCI